MQTNYFKAILNVAVKAACILLFGAAAVSAQQQVNLTASPTSVTLPDGSVVPMWGYSCTVTGTALTSGAQTCGPLNSHATGWSPVVITVPTGQTLTISLTNNLSFAGGTNTVPTSLVIVGQLGGGLGDTTQRTTTAPPDHSGAQAATTWPIAGGAGGTSPTQGNRVQSFSTEVGVTPATGQCSTNPCPLTWSNLRPGTYLIESGTHPSIQGPMGLYGMVVVTDAPSAAAPATTTAGCAYTPVGGTACVVPYNAEADLLLSEIDPVQNNAVQTAVNTAGFSETMVWSGQPGGCGNPASPTYQQCYPPVVNYTPFYYMINGLAFNKTNAPASLFAASPASGVSGSVLVRMVNAGLRMHVPSIVGSQTGAGGASAPSGFSLIAEDGNPLPGIPRVQSEVFMAAGKTYDVMINVPATGASALPVYDRELSLSGNAIARDAGMLAYISVNNAQLPVASGTGVFAAAVANPDTYNAVIAGQTLTVSDPAKGVIANDINVYGVAVSKPAPTEGTLTLNRDGTFTYVANASWSGSDTFGYCGNGATSGAACTTVTLNASNVSDSSITVPNSAYTANAATYIAIKPPGILTGAKDGANLALHVVTSSVTASGITVLADADGGFTATAPGAGSFSFTFQATNSLGTQTSNTATVIVTFPTANGPTVKVLDGVDKTTQITDYRWIIEEDRTFYIDPNCTTNPLPAGCPTFGSTGIVPLLGTNFHTSYMPLVAAGCVISSTSALACEGGQTVLGKPAVCDVGNGVCRPDPTGSGFTPLDPSQVHLDPTKRYYISVLPGDAANPFNTANAVGGHGMGGAPIPAACAITATTCTASVAPVTVLVEPTPFQPSKLTVFVFEDDFPLNGEQDAGGGVDVLAKNEPGLGGFEITLFDDAGGTGDATGQLTHDMFNQPLSNSLAGTIDPANLNDACPIVTTTNPLGGVDSTNGNALGSVGALGITGRIVTCPTYESDGVTLSPLAGQAVVANMMPGRYGVVATPAADRIARGEEWLQTNTLDGQKAHDSFLRVGEPPYFQEFGPAGFHVSIGFANPAIINSRLAGVCAGTDPNLPLTPCKNSLTGSVSTERMSRTPDERLYGSGSYNSFSFTQCFVSIGDPDGEDFAFTKCDSNGNFNFSGLPDGTWRVTIFDQWNDMLVDGLSTPVALAGGTAGSSVNMGQIAMNQWQANIYTTTFFDQNGNGVRDGNETGLTLVATNIRFRDGSYSNFNNTDLSGNAGFNEVFPLFNWYVVETDTTRYKSTGTHVVYDAGGPADGTCTGSAAPCGSSTIAANMANTKELIPVPTNLRVPGAFYCANADCTDAPAAPNRTATTSGTGGSTGRVDPPWFAWPGTEGWQGFSGQNSFLEFGKKPFVVGENGGIHGEVNYASTRPFDDPQLVLHVSWTPNVPNVTVNLYKEDFAADKVTPTLTLVDTTKTTSWDDWAQGFRSDGIPNMNCPGQGTATGTNADLFFFSLYNQPNYLNWYNFEHGGPAVTPLPNNSQFKCYDGMHDWNQLQPAPYDGMYSFPSVTGTDPTTGKPTGTNCSICVTNPDANDPYRYGGSSTPVSWTPGHGMPMLPAGKYVVEVVVPPGYELLKEEDKNILIGDNYIAPVTQQFGALGSIFIIPDQAAVGASYNANNAQNPTQDLGTLHLPRGEGDTGSVEQFWPCVGASRIVPDYISLFPQSAEVSPFAGATRNLCDRKEVALQDQASALAKFYIFSSTHVAAHFTGVITDDFTSEFDPFSPVFGEKFSPANLPVSVRDFNGNEVSRVYSDHWGDYDGLNYSTWEVNPPNPTGYAPTMMVTCMNDKGAIPGPNGTMITDPLFNSQYSQFCYEIPFMPGQTQYMDTPVVPTSAFVGAGYNNPDCNYPTATPAIASVTSQDIPGPWVSTGGNTITITALGDQVVQNYGYSGPGATTPPFNQKTTTRHYGFGSTAGTVTVGGVPLTNVSWSDSTITGTVNLAGTVNGNPVNVPQCAVQQQAQYTWNGTTTATTSYCGELVITAAAANGGRQSIDSITVTIGGKAPTLLKAGQTIQSAIDAATPGDMIIVPPGTYKELLLMWKPVRLQGVGAASSIIDANAHPAGKLDPWRRSVNCLFGLALNGQPNTGANAFDSTGTYNCPSPSSPTASGTGPNGNTWNYFYGGPNFPTMVVDRIPLEGILGWDATVNGNLAEQLQEPSLMGAYEGGGITVLAKGVNIPAGSTDPFGSGAEAGFPAGSTLLYPGNARICGRSHAGANGYVANPFPSNFMCNPSSIDGLGITDASQGGGGIFVHAWAHNLQIANNRVFNNAGTLSGGMSIGQGESPEAYLNGDAAMAAPGSCLTLNGNFTNGNFPLNYQLPYCLNLNANIHNNYIAQNSSTGDELFSGTPAGAGGVSICAGADYYQFNYNWVCGNLSTGDGGGVGHMGFSWNGDIEHNKFLFNQSTNPTIQTNGGGLIAMGAAPDATITVNGVATECGSVTDNDCVPGLSDGTGPGLVINANLFEGNGAEAGSGGGLRLQAVNGTEVARYPNPVSAESGFASGANCATQYRADGSLNCKWYVVFVTNNIIDNNVAGWDGGGVSLEDALAVNLVNNTVSSNDTTASSGVLFNTLGAPLASSQSPAPVCLSQSGGTVSCPQPAGLVSLHNSPQMTSSFTTGAIVCPQGRFQPGTGATNGTCTHISYPILYNNIFWQNRAFQIGVGSLGTGTQNQQNVVSLFNAAFNGSIGSPAASQAFTGACPAGSSYWDIGVRNDRGPTDHTGSGFRLNPLNGVLSPGTSGYSGTNLTSNPLAVSQYCNGSRVPPENGGLGYQVPPGVADATVPNPIFQLTPTATVDEGNNWINMSWGPLSILNPVNSTATTNVVLGNYALQATSPDIDHITCTSVTNGCAVSGEVVTAPMTDFFGNPRPDPSHGNNIDVGAVEFPGAHSNAAALVVTPTSLTFFEEVGITSASQTLTLTNSGSSGASSIAVAVTAPFARAGGSCTTTLAAGANCSITITFHSTSPGTVSGTVTITANVPVTNSPVGLIGTGFTITPTSLALGNELVGTTSAAQSVTVANPSTATATVSISNIAFAGGNASQYTRTATGATDCGTTKALTPGTSCTIGVAFHPTSTGSKPATLNVSVSGSVAGSVSLTGTGTTVSFSAPSPSLFNGALTTHSGTITVTNNSGAAITLQSNPAITQTAGTGIFSIVAPSTGTRCVSGLTVANGATCTIGVQYNPNGTTNTSTANVSISDTFAGGTGTATQNGPNFNAN